jgi:hypothetical protein
MKYRGFNEEPLLAAVKQLEDLGLPLRQIYPIVNVAGAKWRSVQITENRQGEIQDSTTGPIFQKATIAFMQETMRENQALAALGHTDEVDRFMLLAMGVAFDRLVSGGPGSLTEWLGGGKRKKRKTILAFAMGSNILVEAAAIDTMIGRIIQGRYADPDRDLATPILSVIEGLGHAGYACLRPIGDRLS